MDSPLPAPSRQALQHELRAAFGRWMALCQITARSDGIAPDGTVDWPNAGIVRVLRDHRGVIAQAAAELGLTRQSLYRRMERLGIPRR